MSEKYSIRGRSCLNKLVIVMDTSALLAKYHLQIPSYLGEIIVPSRVVEEVRDEENKSALTLGLEINRVKVVSPPVEVVSKVVRVAKNIGEHSTLSKTDIEVAATAYMYKQSGCRVVVFTDDYALQNLLAYLEIPFKPLRTTGIKQLLKYRVYCPVCGYVSFDLYEETCPICGSKLVKKVISRKQL